MLSVTACLLPLNAAYNGAADASLPHLAAAPLPLSDVQLSGAWATAQRLNLNVLLSINMSRWACHFTTTANLTSCSAHNCVAPGDVSRALCDPLPGEMGLGGYYGHYQGHWLSASAFLINATGEARLANRARGAVQTLAAVMDKWQDKYGEDGYL